jgi:hypothetical protein
VVATFSLAASCVGADDTPKPVFQERRVFPWSAVIISGYASLSTPLASVTGIAAGVGVQYQIFSRWNVGVNWKQILGSDPILTALNNVWTIETGYRILGQDYATTREVKLGDDVFVRTEERGRHALYGTLGLQQVTVSTASSGSFAGYRAGLRYENRLLRPLWTSFEVNISTLSSATQTASQMELLVRLRIPVSI